MGTAARDGEFDFVVYTNDHPPPHVHVKFGGQEVRISLDNGEFMDEPPRHKRRPILDAYARHVEVIRQMWDDYHGGDDDAE